METTITLRVQTQNVVDLDRAIHTLIEIRDRKLRDQPNPFLAINGARYDLILDAICERFQVSLAELRGKTQRQYAVHARQAAAYLMRKARHSYYEIGAALCRDHSTVMHGVQAAECRMEIDGAYRAAIAAIYEKLSAREAGAA